MNRESILNAVTVLILIVCTFAFLFTYGEKRRNADEYAPWRMSKEDVTYINANLTQRNAPDCVLEPTIYGYKCTTADKKVYRIARR